VRNKKVVYPLFLSLTTAVDELVALGTGKDLAFAE
jgi:hypothetical protein